jgi:hypothetical protein
MELLDMKPANYSDMTPGLRKLIFLGLTPDNTEAIVRFNSMCLAYLMHTAHNEIRHGTTGLDLGVSKEQDTLDWAALTLSRAAHGHGFMSKELTRRGNLGRNIAGKVVRDKSSKRNKAPSSLEERANSDGRSSRTINTPASNNHDSDQNNSFRQGADLNIGEVRNISNTSSLQDSPALHDLHAAPRRG